MKSFLHFLALVLMVGGAYAQSDLPACPFGDVKNLSNCWGRFVYPQGTVWVGELKGGIPNGEGILYSNGGKVLESGILNGTSLISSYKIDPSRYPYEILGGGYAKNNLPACQGSDASRWSNCVGTFSWSGGFEYTGEWKDNKFNGQGSYTYPNGGRTVGEFKDGKRHGQGTHTYPNGERYVGEFKYDKADGQGTEYASNGSVINQGIYADNAFVRSAPVQQATTSSALSNSAEIDRLSAEVEAERKKRQELETQLAASVKPSPPQTNAPRRIAHALVIGNGAYPGSGRLDNPCLLYTSDAATKRIV